MAGHEIEATEQDLELARRGVMIQLEGHITDEALRQKFLDNGGQAFIDNQINVIARERASCRFYASALHPRDMGS